MIDLDALPYRPCDPNDVAITQSEFSNYAAQLPGWECIQDNHICKVVKHFECKDYKDAISLTNDMACLAEAVDHHPEIILRWGQVTVIWWTHMINGLHINDVILARKSDLIYNDMIAKQG